MKISTFCGILSERSGQYVSNNLFKSIVLEALQGRKSYSWDIPTREFNIEGLTFILHNEGFSVVNIENKKLHIYW